VLNCKWLYVCHPFIQLVHQPAKTTNQSFCLSVCLLWPNRKTVTLYATALLKFPYFYWQWEMSSTVNRSLNCNTYVQTDTHNNWTCNVCNMNNFVNLQYIRHLDPSMFNPFHATDKMIRSTTNIFFRKIHEWAVRTQEKFSNERVKVNFKNFSTPKALPCLALWAHDTTLARQLWKDVVYSKSSSDVTAYCTHQMGWVWKAACHFKC
jgi:hypothetical protein